MESTPRFRVFDSRRSALDLEEEESGRALPRRRMVTSVSVARQRRRNRRRPGAPRRGFQALSVPRLLLLSLCSGSASSQRRLLLVLFATGAFVFARLFSFASSSLLSSSALPPPSSSLRPRSDDAGPDGAAPAKGGKDVDGRRHQKGGGGGGGSAAVSLGPDAIPSVVIVERRSPSGHSGLRKASGLGGGGALGAWTLQQEEGEEGHPRRCLNTVQGMTLIADSEGRVCRRTELDGIHRPGCCASAGPPLVLRRPEGDGGDRGGAGGGELGSPLGGVRHTGGRVPASSVMTTTATGVEGHGGGLHEGGGHLELVALSQGMDGHAAAAAAAPVVGRGGDVENDGFPPDQALSTPFSCWSCDIVVGGAADADSGGFPGTSSPSSCCQVYEFCVSCCQGPGRREEREAIGAAAALSGHPAYRELQGQQLLDSAEGDRDNEGGAARTERLRATVEARRTDGKGTGGKSQKEEDKRQRRASEEAFSHCAFRCRTYSGSVAHENSYRSPLKHCFGRFRPPAEAPAAAAAAAEVGGGGGGTLVGLEREGRVPPPLQLDPFLGGLDYARI